MIIDVTPLLCVALAGMPSCHRKLNELYYRAPGACLAAVRQYSNKNNPAFKCSRAEKEILAYRALGVLLHCKDTNDTTTPKALYRAANRWLFDKVAAGGMEIETKPILKEIGGQDITNEEMLEQAVLLYTIIHTYEKTMTDDDLQTVVKNYVLDVIHETRKPSQITDEVRERGRTIFEGYDRLNVDCLYVQSTEAIQKRLSKLFYVASGLGFLIPKYCTGIELTPDEAAFVAIGNRPIEGAMLACVFKAMRMDREYCLSIAKKDKTAELEITKAETAQAQRETRQLRSRITGLERIAQEAEKKVAKLEAELAEANEYQQEVISLRNALYAAQTQEEEATPENKPQRSIPQGAVLIGGHETWARGMRKALPGVTVYSASVSFDEKTIRSASELWFLADYLSHTDFYRAVNTARQYHVPIYYFSSRGVKRCLHEFLSLET